MATTPAPARKRSTATRTAPAKPKAAAAPEAASPRAAATTAGGAEGLLRAGLKALGTVRDDVVKRQSDVIGGLLGIQPNLDTFGIRKFEDVFDQRVVAALQRLGWPDAAAVQALRDEVAELRERLAALEGTATPARRARR